MRCCNRGITGDRWRNTWSDVIIITIIKDGFSSVENAVIWFDSIVCSVGTKVLPIACWCSSTSRTIPNCISILVNIHALIS